MSLLGYCVIAFAPGRFSSFVPVSRRKTDPATKTHPNDLRDFPTLESIVHFYNTRDLYSCANMAGTPVTPADLGAGIMPPANGTCWPAPEVAANMNTAELGNLGLGAAQEQMIVAFLKTLTDQPLATAASVLPDTAFPPMP